MRVSDELKECVGFLCVKESADSEQLTYGGTAFFVAVPSEISTDVDYLYLITARHCVEKAKSFGSLYLRLNKRDGGVGLIKLKPEWCYPADEGIDAAVLPIDFNLDHYLVRNLPIAMAPSSVQRESLGIGIGNELFAVGLFTERYGAQRNIPIVRRGIIAAMPEEPLSDKDSGLPYDGYLAEMMSIRGLSGTPVFVELFMFDPHIPGVPSYEPPISRSWHLLGLIRGHWDYGKAEAIAYDAEEKVNVGIAVVTPFDPVLEILNRDDLRRERRRADKQQGPVLD